MNFCTQRGDTMNTNTFDANEVRSYAPDSEAAVPNTRSSSTQTMTAIVLWAVVAIPMLWGVLKAWGEVQLMF
jgi:hypothetical protein